MMDFMGFLVRNISPSVNGKYQSKAYTYYFSMEGLRFLA